MESGYSSFWAQFSKQGWTFNITARVWFYVYDCRVAIPFEISMLFSFHRDECHSSIGLQLLGSTGCHTVHHIYICRQKNKHPAHSTCHMLSQAFMYFARSFDWSQQTSKGCLFTSWQQVNILHSVPSCWKSEQCMRDISSVVMVNNQKVWGKEERLWRAWPSWFVQPHKYVCNS